MTRCINGKFFTCQRPGYWRSDDDTIGIYLVMQGTVVEQWEVYEDVGGSGQPMDNGALVGYGLTMKEAVAAWAETN